MFRRRNTIFVLAKSLCSIKTLKHKQWGSGFGLNEIAKLILDFIFVRIGISNRTGFEMSINDFVKDVVLSHGEEFNREEREVKKNF